MFLTLTLALGPSLTLTLALDPSLDLTLTLGLLLSRLLVYTVRQRGNAAFLPHYVTQEGACATRP